jgi:hypothetical protein
MSQDSIFEDLDGSRRADIVLDAYRKHASELLALEESQQKLVLLLLGVFGGGASDLASTRLAFGTAARVGLSVFVAAVLIVAWEYTRRRDFARQGIRALLVQCEIALGFYDEDIYVKGSLYPPNGRDFPTRGAWLSRTFWLAVLAAIGFLVVLWGSASVSAG